MVHKLAIGFENLTSSDSMLYIEYTYKAFCFLSLTEDLFRRRMLCIGPSILMSETNSL